MFINPEGVSSSELKKIANQIRFKIIELSHTAKSAHLGS